MMKTRTLEMLAGGQVKGSIIGAHLRWAESEIGAGCRAELTSRVSPESAEVLNRTKIALGWQPFALLVELDKAIAELVGGPSEIVYHELGRHSARLNLRGVYRAFTRSKAHDFFAQEAMHHRQFLDFGQAKYERTGDTSCALSLMDMTCFSPVQCVTAEGYYNEAALIHRCSSIIVAETSCCTRGDDNCVFEISWR